MLFTVFRGKGGDEGSTETPLVSAVIEGKRQLWGGITLVCPLPASMLGLHDLWNKNVYCHLKNLFDR